MLEVYKKRAVDLRKKAIQDGTLIKEMYAAVIKLSEEEDEDKRAEAALLLHEIEQIRKESLNEIDKLITAIKQRHTEKSDDEIRQELQEILKF